MTGKFRRWLGRSVLEKRTTKSNALPLRDLSLSPSRVRTRLWLSVETALTWTPRETENACVSFRIPKMTPRDEYSCSTQCRRMKVTVGGGVSAECGLHEKIPTRMLATSVAKRFRCHGPLRDATRENRRFLVFDAFLEDLLRTTRKC